MVSYDSYNAGPAMSMANAAIGLERRPVVSPAGTASQVLKSPEAMQFSRSAKSSADT